MEIVSSVASKVTELLFDPIVRQSGYIWNYNSNVQKLRDQVEMLKAEEQQLQRQVEAAKENEEKIEAGVEIWMRRASEIATDADMILHQYETASKTCFIGLCPNFKTRHQLGRRAAKQIPAVAEVRGEGSFDRISYRDAPQGMVPVINHQGFGSRESVLEDIVQALKDADTSSVGVYGMGGVGKTTLVNEVASRVREQGIFKVVVMAVVTHNPDVKEIQKQIAEWLQFELKVESVQVRAQMLNKRLKREERILVILDDIWSPIRLEDIGIPCGTLMTSRNPKDEGIPRETECRILMTSRNRNVLSKMNVKKDFLLHVLKDEEAWTLFEKTVGNFEDEEIRRKAFEVAKRCSGLPILIVTVAAALRDKELAEWSDAIRWLTRFGDDDIDERVKSGLELSYNHLKGDEIKSLFLLCALLPSHDINVRELLRYSVGLNLFKQISTLESVKDRLHKLINDLKASCMLLEGDKRGSFKMHDVIHNFAISVASKESKVFTVSYDNELEKWLEKDKLQQYTAISLPFCKMPGFPAEFSCPKLKSFLLHSEDKSQNVPDIFFRGMQQLEVMALKCIYLSPLPSSLEVLQNLQTLCLDKCDLGDIGMVGGLKNLRVLSFMGSNIVQLPIELRQLNCLRLLDLTNCSNLKVIPPNLLSSLSQLEDLYMGNSFSQWDEKGEHNASLTELKALSKLVTLDLHIVDAKILPRDLFSEKLTRFRIFIGDKWNLSDEYEISKSLILNFNTGINQLLVKVKELLKITEDLYLHELTGSTNVLYELDWEGFTLLKHLHVKNSPGIQYLVDSSGMCPHVAFPKLESLFLDSLINLEKICRSPLMSEVFRSLRKLNVSKCNRLKNLFTFSMARGLVRLEEINVSWCHLVEEIISGEIGEEEALEFPKLHALTLEYLPKISSFSSQSRPLPSAASREIASQDDELESALPLFNTKIKFPNLTDLKLSSIAVEKIWRNQLTDLSSCANKLSTLIVDGCENLKYLFSSRMIQSFAQLKRLGICDCKSMEKIIATHGPGDGEMTTTKIRFGKLEFLELRYLPKLINFCTCSFMECPSLTVLRIERCPELKTLIPNSSSTEGEFGQTNLALLHEKVSFPMLEELHIMDMQVLKHAWGWNIEDPITTVSFAKLRLIIVWHCPSLKSLFSASIAKNLQGLETLFICDCSVLEEIVMKEETVKTTPKFVFPQLKALELFKLEQLKSFYSGNHTLGCPTLQSLAVTRCERLKIFDLQAEEDMQSSTNMEGQLTKVMPESVILDNAATQLTLDGFDDASLNFPFNFLRVFRNVDHLILENSSRREIFPNGIIIDDEDAIALSRIRFLKLFLFDQLRHLWNQDSQHGQLLPNLESLEICDCDELNNLAPSSTFFQNLTTLNVSNCDGLINLVTTSTAKGMANLTHMTVEECQMMTEIVADECQSGSEIIFKKLTSLKLLDLRSLTSFSTSMSCTIEIPSLEVVVVSKCPKMKVFSPGFVSSSKLQKVHITNNMDEWRRVPDEWRWVKDLNTTIQLLHAQMIGFSGIEQLTLSEFSQLKDVWLDQSLPVNFFTELKKLVVDDSEIFSVAVPSNLLPCLNELLKLKVRNCDSVEDIFGPTLPNVDGQSSEHLFRLEELELINLPRLRRLWSEVPNGFLDFKNLEVLKIHNCNSLRNVFSPATCSGFVQLRLVEVKSCDMVEFIVTEDGAVKGTSVNEIKFPLLKSITLESLPRLNNFNSGSGIVYCPTLAEITIVDCPTTFASTFLRLTESLKIDGTAEQKITFPNLTDLKLSSCIQKTLTTLVIDGCENLSYLFTPSMIENLAQLKNLVICDCKSMKIVIAAEDTTTKIPFPELQFLKIKGCPQVITFISNIASADEVGQINSILFNEKIACPNLAELQIFKMNNLNMIWDNQLHPDSFCKLEKLTVEDGKGLLKIFPASMLERLQNLKNLSLKNCDLVEELFDLQELVTANLKDLNNVATSQLSILHIDNLPNLKHIWNDDLLRTLSFLNLCEIYVQNCSCLEWAFPASIAEEGLLKLESLEIGNCCGMENIVAKKEEMKATPKFVFPDLQFLELWELRNLKSFYPGIHILETPILNSLRVFGCVNLETFVVKPQNLQKVQIEDERQFGSQAQSLYSFEKVIPNLRELTLRSKDIPMIQLQGPFHTVEKLELQYFHEENLPYSPFDVLAIFPNVETLVINSCDFKELFSNELVIQGKHATSLAQIRGLQLHHFPYMTRICSQNPQLEQVLQNIEELCVCRCHSLINLVPSSVSFSNLTELIVS